MTIHQLAGKLAPHELITNLPRLVAAYYTLQPDPDNPEQLINFGTSGHRGTSIMGSFNETHILAICQSLCEYRQAKGFNGPLFLGMDTHALSEPALRTAIEVFASNGVELMIQPGLGYTPTPVISRAILAYNHGRKTGLSDGVVITPSHNPPEDGGFKYNPPAGGPAGIEVTSLIQNRANQILKSGLKDVHRISLEKALKATTTHEHDFVRPYVDDLENVIEMRRIAASGLKIGVDPLGGAGVDFWEPIAETYGLNLTVINRKVDASFNFMTIDHDGKIRMDCSSPYAMASLIRLKDEFDIAFGNDPDADRHGIVTPRVGLLEPNHYLAVAIRYLFEHRKGWNKKLSVGKTLVSSSMIDHVTKQLNRQLCEMPVGFKFFVDGLLGGSLGFAGEESAGASFLRKDGTVWTTDKDGILLGLLSAEIMAVTEQALSQQYEILEAQFGKAIYERKDVEAGSVEKKVLSSLSRDMINANTLAGEQITAIITHAPYNGAPIGGVKVIAESGWFAARPSGTENVYKIYAESFKGEDHLHHIQEEAETIISAALKNG